MCQLFYMQRCVSTKCQKVLFVLGAKLFLMVINKIWINVMFENIMQVKGKLLASVSFFVDSR